MKPPNPDYGKREGEHMHNPNPHTLPQKLRFSIHSVLSERKNPNFSQLVFSDPMKRKSVIRRVSGGTLKSSGGSWILLELTMDNGKFKLDTN